jgi:hypothetical protein
MRERGVESPSEFKCDYPNARYSAELSCAKCRDDNKLCGSRAIQAAQGVYVDKQKERRKKGRNARQTERRKNRKKREAKRELKRQRQKEQEADILRATARKRLKQDRRVAALHLELTLLHRAHVEWASLTKSEEQREQECRRKREQEDEQQLKLLATMKGLLRAHERLLTVLPVGRRGRNWF